VIPDADADFCYVTTTGRRSGRRHRIEIWFATASERDTIYLLAGGRERADWVRNLRVSPDCVVLIGERTYVGHARIVEGTDEDEIARTLVHDKYARGDDLTTWRGEALPVAIDLEP
jgi:deazaflavin-dependent oxidoreductase (nitroreductase family)